MLNACLPNIAAMPAHFDKNRVGISTAVLAAIIVVVVAIAAVGGYYLLTLPTSTTQPTTSQTSTSTSTQQTQTQTSTQQSSSSSIATSSSATNTTTGPPLNLINSAQNLLGNFSQMTMRFSAQNSSTGPVLNATWSFHVVGKATINGSALTIVNYTITSSGESQANFSALVYYNPNWNITMVTMNGANYTGVIASTFIGAFSVMFTSFFSYENQFLANQTLFSRFVQQKTSSQTFGNLTMQVTTYTVAGIAIANASISNASIGIGKIPNTNLSMLTYFHVEETLAGTQHSYTLELVSATRT